MRAIETFRRSELEARIEEMIALLDLIDGDPDLEDAETEDIDEREETMDEDSGLCGRLYLIGVPS